MNPHGAFVYSQKPVHLKNKRKAFLIIFFINLEIFKKYKR